MNEPVVIAGTTDDLYAMPLAVTMRSALDNLQGGTEASIWVLCNELTERSRKKIAASLPKDIAELHFCECGDLDFWDLYVRSKSNYPPASYFRLGLAELLPKSVERVIYLDSDMVVQRDLGELWSQPVSDCHMLAAMDAANRTLGWPGHLSHLDFAALGLSPDQRYLQSGVLLINLSKWREDDVLRKLLSFMNAHPELRYPDMDALNIVLGGKWREIDPRWNQLPCVYGFPSAEESPYSREDLNNVLHDPYIIHYGSHPKPWEPGCTHPLQQEWFRYLDRTDWGGWRVNRMTHLYRRIRQAKRRAVKLLARKTGS